MGRKDTTTEYRGTAAGNSQFKEIPQFSERLVSLREKLHQKAKQEPAFRFYALYDRIYRRDVLEAAWLLVRRNRGAPGVDGVTIDQIDRSENGPARLVDTLQDELRTKSYKPQPVLRVFIPKPDGRQRPLGIPTVRDRVVQMAAMLILEPIFEADFLECSYGFRPGRSAHQALGEIRSHIQAGYREVYDADLKGYFDTIPHEKLMTGLRTRIADSSVLKLIRMWLQAPVVERGDDGPRISRPKTGTPQGGVISPLLANSFLHWFDRSFHGPTGPARWADARLIRYADDFVVLARYVGRPVISWIEHTIEGRLGLTINRDKTRVVNLWRIGEHLDFLGFSFRYDRDLQGRPHGYLNLFPSSKALARARDNLRNLTGPEVCFVPIPDLIERLNLYLNGWRRYFDLGYPRMAFRHIDRFVRQRLYRHLRRRSQRPYRPPEGKSWDAHLADLGLVRL